MWWFKSKGFIGVAAHSGKPDTLSVRARDEDSLLSLLVATRATPRHRLIKDYLYRIEALREAFSAWLVDQALNVDYTNYMAHRWSERPEFGQVLHDVFASMLAVEGPRVTEADRQRATVLYPNQTWADHELEMAKAIGHF